MRLIFILALCITALTSGCALRREPLAPSNIPMPLEQMVMRVSDGNSGKGILRSLARLSITSPSMTYSRKVAVVLKQPSSLRMDAIPLFGTPDFIFSATGRSLKVFLPQEGKFYIGKPSGRNLYSFFRIPFSVRETVSLLEGLAPMLDEAGLTFKGFREEEDYRIETYGEGEIRRILWIDVETMVLKKLEVFGKGGKMSYAAFFDDYITFGGRSYPLKVKATLYDKEIIDMKVQFEDINISASGVSSPFSLLPPRGIRPTFID